jgi:hypothetical protein
MPRPNIGREMVSVRLGEKSRHWIEDLARQRRETRADTLRTMLLYASRFMPHDWKPER